MDVDRLKKEEKKEKDCEYLNNIVLFGKMAEWLKALVC